MPPIAAGGRDKPHSPPGPARSAADEADTGARATGSSGLVTEAASIAGGLVVAAVLVAVSPLPDSLVASAERAIVAPTPGPLGALWDALVLALPVGERGARDEFAVLLMILAVAASAGLLASRLYRGTGRGAATFAAVPVCAASLLVWSREAGADAPAALGFTLLATLGLVVFVGARVRGRGASAATWLRGGAATIAAALLWPRVGPAWAAVVFGYAAWTMSDTRRPGRRGLVTLAAVVVPVAVAGLLSTWPEGQDLRLLVDLGPVSRWSGVALLDLALALSLLLIAPLRWRGGGLLLTSLTTGLTIGDLGGRLLPAPAILVLIAVAGCGWIWLAGSVRVPWRWVAPLGVVAATLAILGLVLARFVPATRPAAQMRPEASLLALYQRGLIAPGDVLLAHDPWLVAAFAAAQRDEGMRPDVALHAAASVDSGRLSDHLAGWSRAGRRVLSDSFNYAGRWQSAWALDSGPLFWFVGTAGAADRDFTDLRDHSPELSVLVPEERARWERLHLERARHRRALGHSDEALLALPFDVETLAALAQRLQLAKLSRLPAIAGSELGPGAWPAAAPPASTVAEVGDLLRALGDGAAGTQRLEEAAALGVPDAFGALARWQLRAGEDEAARATLAVIETTPVLRPQLLAVCRWLLARARVGQADALLTGLGPARGHATEELGVRLGVLRGLAGP